MTACCGTDVLVFGHVHPDCPDTMLPALDAAARADHLRWLDQLATRPGAAPSIRDHFRRQLTSLTIWSRT